MTPDESFAAYYERYCDCRPLPDGVDARDLLNDWEGAGLIVWRTVTEGDLDSCWVYDWGLELGDSCCTATPKGYEVLK